MLIPNQAHVDFVKNKYSRAVIDRRSVAGEDIFFVNSFVWAGDNYRGPGSDTEANAWQLAAEDLGYDPNAKPKKGKTIGADKANKLKKAERDQAQREYFNAAIVELVDKANKDIAFDFSTEGIQATLDNLKVNIKAAWTTARDIRYPVKAVDPEV